MKATLEGATFNRLIGAVRNFTGKGDVRPQTRLIQLHFCKGLTSVEAYALDGCRSRRRRKTMKLKCKYMIEFEMEEVPYMRPLKEIKETAPQALRNILEDELETAVTVTEVSAVIEEA